MNHHSMAIVAALLASTIGSFTAIFLSLWAARHAERRRAGGGGAASRRPGDLIGVMRNAARGGSDLARDFIES